MRDETTFFYRRWYDQERSCHQLLLQIRSMPQPQAREFCARVIAHIAEKLRKEVQKKGMGGVSSIGVPALSSLYRFGSQRHRWYDGDPVIHKTVGLMYTLPTAGLSALGFKLGDTMGLMQIYASVCHQLDQPPDMKEMAKICITSLQAGREEAEEVLISIIGKDLYESLRHLNMNNSWQVATEPSELI